MKVTKRLLALALCLAMLLSGFAMADAETDPMQGQTTVQSETEITGGGEFF